MDTEEPKSKTPLTAGISLWGWPLGIVLGCYALDQLTKWIVIRSIAYGEAIAVIPGFFSLVHLRNTGAAWSILSGYTWLLALISVTALVAIAALFRRWNGGSRLMAAMVALLLGGIAGNMTDRLFRGNVVDFLDFSLCGYHWPAFNVADSAICVSIAVLIFVSWRQEKQRKQ